MTSTLQLFPNNRSWLPGEAPYPNLESLSQPYDQPSRVEDVQYTFLRSETTSTCDAPAVSPTPSSPDSRVGFDTVLAVIGVYQAARHNWDRSEQVDPALRQALTEAASLIESLVHHYRYLDAHSRQLLDFFLVVWSWRDVEVVVPPSSLMSQLHD